MKISYNWLKDYININHSPEELAEILTATGLEVEGIEHYEAIKGGLKGLVVGHVQSKEKHPNADKLSLAKVDIGEDEPLSIVCGAENLAEDQKVVVATVGTTIYPIEHDAFTIKKAKIRGEASYGMICAEDEIGVGHSHEGIIVLDNSVAVGTPIAEIYSNYEDWIFEIGLTPNRSDAMSHIGVARDIMAALNVKEQGKYTLHIPSSTIQESRQTTFHIEIKDKEACPRYSGIVIDNVTVKDSPQWLKDKLKAIGVRPINNVVDITNFVLKEFGQALHAFDYSAIKGDKIVVQTLAQNTSFETLDNVVRKLDAEDLMICNANEPMCIAGVFGGAHSGVTESTTKVFIESAYFESTSIRKTSTRHQLRTDAAQRYEKGADPEITIEALKRASALIVEIARGEIISPILDEYPNKIDKVSINLSHKNLERLSGIQFEADLVQRILMDLDFEEIQLNEDTWTMKAPLYRADVKREADVIEEIMRIYGFDNIPIPSSVKSVLSFQNGINNHQIQEQLAFILNGLGYHEIMTNSITQSSFYKENENLVRLQNSMTAELDSMRKSLIPEALQVIAYNINRKNADLKLFEFGTIYLSDKTEKNQLAVFQTGANFPSNWLNKDSNASIYNNKGVIDEIFNHFKISYAVNLTNKKVEYKVKEGIIASLSKIDEEDLKPFDIEQAVFTALIDWDLLITILKKQKIKFSPIPKYQKVNRDLAIVIEESVAFESIKQAIEELKIKELQQVKLFDVYRHPEKIGQGKKSYALNFTLQHPNKTMTDKEIERYMSKIESILTKNCQAEIRK